MMSNHPDEPLLKVDPSESADAIAAPSGGKEEEEGEGGRAPDKGKQPPSASSKGINPVQHSE